MNKQKRWIWIAGGFVLLIAGLLVGAAGLLGLLPWQSSGLYEDPQGRFTMEIGPNWKQVETDGSYAQFQLTNPAMDFYVLVLEAKTVKEDLSRSLEMVGFDPGLRSNGVASVGDWQAISLEDSAGLSYGFADQVVGEKAYIILAKGVELGVSVQNTTTFRALNSIKIAGREDLVIESYADLEAMVQKKVDSLAGSVSIALVHKDKVIYTYAYGQANPVEGIAADTQTIYQFASMTKLFTATALMQLVEQGRVDLDTWAGEYIPEFPKRWNVTVRQLLDHSACMPEDERLTMGLIANSGESFAPYEEILTAYVKDHADLVCEPGKVSQYANAHYLTLARIIEEVSGEPYETYVIDHILVPLEMESTRFELVEPDERYAKGQFPTAMLDELVGWLNEYRGPGHEAIILQKGELFSSLTSYRILPPWGGLRGTPSDLTHFLQMYINDGSYGDVQILKPETVAAMEEMQKSTDGSDLGLGLSWWIEKDDFWEFYYHGGSAAGAEDMMRYYPDLDLGVVVMANVAGYQSDNVAEALVNAWKHEK